MEKQNFNLNSILPVQHGKLHFLYRLILLKPNYVNAKKQMKSTSLKIEIQWWCDDILWILKITNKHCEILVSCSDKVRNCIQAHETACKLMELHVSSLNFNESSGNCMQAQGTFLNILEHSACILLGFSSLFITLSVHYSLGDILWTRQDLSPITGGGVGQGENFTSLFRFSLA